MSESRIGAVIAETFAVRAATSMDSTVHAQHGAGLILGLDSEVTLTGPEGLRVSGRAVVVPPDFPHAITCAGPTVGLLYDPEAAPHVAGYSRRRGGAFPLEGRLAERVGEALSTHRAALARPDVLAGLAGEVSDWLTGEASYRGLDRRVARALEGLRDPEADRRLVLERTRLSEAHLQALFVRDVGVPIRTFQLWRRLLAALVAFSRMDATSAAHAAGFADLAHFSRTCRRMLGYSPTVLRDKLMPS